MSNENMSGNAYSPDASPEAEPGRNNLNIYSSQAKTIDEILIKKRNHPLNRFATKPPSPTDNSNRRFFNNSKPTNLTSEKERNLLMSSQQPDIEKYKLGSFQNSIEHEEFLGQES